jgi:hypothetical protein
MIIIQFRAITPLCPTWKIINLYRYTFNVFNIYLLKNRW